VVAVGLVLLRLRNLILGLLRGVTMNAVVLIWFTGAIGLLFRKAIGWFCSLIGSGIAAGFFVSAIIELVSLIHHPNAQLTRLKDMGGPVDLQFVYFVVGAFMSIPAIISLLLFVGLLFKRKELVAPRESVVGQ
jgi:hypothetical protein